MALLIQRTHANGVVTNYHRVGELKVGPAVCTCTVEGYLDFDTRANPASKPTKEAFDFLRVAGQHPLDTAYRALLAMPEWASAQTDVDPQPTPAAVPAVPTGLCRWDADLADWVLKKPPPTAEQALDRALADIDTAAGQARLKYITAVPGQAETYQRKEQQAREWAGASFAGAAPSFIAVEASARGLDAQTLAETIIQRADYWVYVKGPEIEGCRLKWKDARRSTCRAGGAMKKYLWNLLVSLDQLLNTATWGDPDETVSSRAAKAARKGERWGCVLCRLLHKLDPNHCEKNIELDEGEKA
jgi:hypothetical protein